ncbi:FAD-binding protein [Lactobacillus sp. XV13L]|nr:FAD-binding protein [Lactobacillus sp. XV13L]
MEKYDVVIIGAGPAGLTAGLYSSRYQLKTLILEKDEIGGRTNQITKLTSYPGIKNISGPDFIANLKGHAESFGAKIIKAKPKKIMLQDDYKLVHTRKGDYLAKALIVATGMQPKKFDVPGEDELAGMGVSYCATCDAEFYRNQKVVVIGSNDQAINEGLMTCKYAKEVDVIVNHPEGQFDCSSKNKELAEAEPKMKFTWNCELVAINGEMNVESIIVKHTDTDKKENLSCDGVFLYGGMIPATAFIADLASTDEDGYFHPKDDMSITKNGIFAAGDVRKRYLSQVVTSASDGSVAAAGAQDYITHHMFDDTDSQAETVSSASLH